MTLPRRQFLSLAAVAGTMIFAPRMALAKAATDRRFVFIIQRGAADGLNIVIPYADPAYRTLRGDLAIDPATALRLDGSFALHPALVQVADMYGKGQAAFVHAVASPYRDRSHFDAQNVLETGGTAPYATKDGWLNRLVGMLPDGRTDAIAFAPTIPMALRGTAAVTSFAPSALPQATDDLLVRVGQLYEGDPLLHPLWATAMATRGMGNSGDAGSSRDAAAIGKTAAGFLTRPDGPRIAMLETGGWDTHNAQAGRLANGLKQLDAMLGALRDGLGPVWDKTTVLIATEFGRTAAANGTGGTDHGTGSAALLVGGAVRGGRVIADWPGLATAALLDGRDLRPTMDINALVAGVAAQAFALDPARVAARLFASEHSLRPVEGIIRA